MDVAVVSKRGEQVAVPLNSASACPAPGVEPPNPIIIPLAGMPLSWGSNRMVRLTWQAARGSWVVIYRNGRGVAATPNDGYHEDNVRGLAGPFRYKVCEQTHARSCSPEVVVSF
jgi:hypothetical protein